MKIVFALGNPGTEYERTRHNAGFLALDFYANQKGAEFQPKTKFNADIAELVSGEEKMLLVKPTTYYNETGTSARALADFYKLDTTDILVVHDEMALPFGTLRTREKGSDAGNNGIKSLNAHLGEQYARIRIGIWNNFAERVPATHFVLSQFSSDEVGKLKNDILPKISNLIDEFISGNHTITSHKM